MEQGPFRGEIQRGFEKLPGMQCFVCAPAHLNPHGLNLVFEATAQGARTRFRVGRHLESYPGYVHGGVLCAVLDETMGYAGVYMHHVLPFTRALSVRFRSVAAPGQWLVCESVVEEKKSSGYLASAVVKDERGRSLVRAEGEFVVPDFRMAKKMLGGKDISMFQDFFPNS